MPSKRRWGQWPKRVSEEINGISGVAGLGGVAVSAGGLTFLAGAAAMTLTGLGVIAVVGAVGYAAYKAVPPRMRSPEDLVGQVINVSELDDIHPSIKTLAIIGSTQAGKTTLKSRLSFDFSPKTRTQDISAYVVSLPTSPTNYLAILDGAGDTYAQQFLIAEKCDLLCVMVDHNISHVVSAIDLSRLEQHKSLLEQVRRYLDQTDTKQKSQARILINKHDLWRSESQEHQDNLTTSFNEEAEKLIRGRYVGKAEYCAHSNESADDVAALMQWLKETIRG
jgi:uncharacterized protein (DUF305 family)